MRGRHARHTSYHIPSHHIERRDTSTSVAQSRMESQARSTKAEGLHAAARHYHVVRMTTPAPSLPIPHGDRQRLASPPLPPPPTQIDSRMLLPVGQITHSRPPLSMRRPESSLSHNPNSLGVCTRLHSQDPSDSPPIAGAQKGIGPPLHPQRRAAQRGGPPALQPCGALATPSPIAQSIMPHQI